MMKRLVVPLFVAGMAPLMGCVGGGAASTSSAGHTAVELTVDSVVATRVPGACGVTEPPFSSKDDFVLEVTGDSKKPTIGELTVKLAAEVATGTPIELALAGETAGVEAAASPDGTVQVSLTLEVGEREIGSSRVASVVVTVDSMPATDGQLLSAEVVIDFVDGDEVDQTYSAPLRTAVVICPKPAAN
jgi:hypothetical protein